MTQTPWRRY
jgi:hypothetical protein